MRPLVMLAQSTEIKSALQMATPTMQHVMEALLACQNLLPIGRLRVSRTGLPNIGSFTSRS
eukprot:SAG25_NODE_9_length_28981_cov_95.245274_7_plen_61_part_00